MKRSGRLGRIKDILVSNHELLAAFISLIIMIAGLSSSVVYQNNIVQNDAQQIQIFHNSSKYKLMEEVANDSLKITSLESQLNSSKSQNNNLTSEINGLNAEIKNLQNEINLKDRTGIVVNYPDLQLTGGQSKSSTLTVTYSGLLIVEINATCNFKITLTSDILNIVPISTSGSTGITYYFELPVIGTPNNPNTYNIQFTNTYTNYVVYNPTENLIISIYEKY